MSTSNTAPTSGFVTLKAPRFVLAPASEFQTAADGSPIALKTYEGADWSGWPYHIISCKKKRSFNVGDLLDASGDLRGVTAKNPGWELSFTIQHDRGMPLVEPLDLVTVWIKEGAADADGNQTPVKKQAYVVEIGADEGSAATAQYMLTIRYTEGLCDITELVVAKCDQLGRVMSQSTNSPVITATVKAPGELPLSPAYDITGAESSNLISAPGTALANGDRVKILSLTGGAGLTVGNTYFVRQASGITFKAATANSDATIVNFSTDITAGTIAVE
jgi:hypothetical protein